MSDDPSTPNTRRELALDRFWDGLAGRGPAAPARDDLDPILAEAIRRLHALDARAASTEDPAFGPRLWEELMEAHAHAGSIPLRPILPDSNGRTNRRIDGHRPPRAHQALPAPRTHRRVQTALSFIAAAAIVAVMVLLIVQIYDQNQQATPGPASPTAEPGSQSAGWPTMLANNQRTGATEDDGPTGDFVPLWTFTAPAMANNPIMAGDTVLLQSADGTLYCVERATGQQRWAIVVGSPVDGNVMSYPAVDGDTVYAGGQWGDVFALDLATGAVKWRVHVADDSIEASILVQDGAVYTGTSAGLFVALNALDGSERWRYEDGQDYINTFPAFANGVIYVGGPRSVRALDAATGALVWEAPTDGQVRGAAFEGGVVYAPTAPGSVYALSAADGSQLWMQSFPDVAPGLSVAVSNGTVVAGFGAGGMMGFDAETGAMVWQTPDAGGELTLSKVSIANGVAYAYFGPRGGILALDLATGQEVGFGAAEESRMPPVIVDGVLYVGSEVGVAYAFASEGTASTPQSTNATPAVVPAPQPTPTPAPVTTGEGPPVRYLDSFGGWDPAAEPVTPMLSPDGELWVATTDGKIAIFDLDGNLKEIWGSPGTQSGQFLFAGSGFSSAQVVWKPDGGFYVVDVVSIQEFDANRAFVRYIGPYGDPQSSGVPGLGLDPDGTLWVSYYMFRRIDHLAADGTLLGSFTGEGTPGGTLNSPFVPLLTTDGRLVVGEQDGNRVRIFDKQGNELGELGANDPAYGGMYRPGSFTIDETDTIYVANRDTVDVFDPQGRYVASFGGTGTGEGQFRTVNGVAVNGTKTLFVADALNNRIQKFALTGPWPGSSGSTTDASQALPTATAVAVTPGVQATFLWSTDPGGFGPLALAPNGTLWSLDILGGRVTVLDKDGAIVETWGEPGNVPGQFSFIMDSQDGFWGDIAFAPDGSFWIAECGNKRVQHFDAQRQPIGSIGTAGEGDGQFRCPSGVVVGTNGDLYVGDFLRGDVQRFSPDGTFVAAYGGFGRIAQLSLDGHGDILATLDTGHRVVRLSLDGETLAEFGATGGAPGALVLPADGVEDAAGNVIVVDQGSDTVNAYDATGTYIGSFDVSGTPAGPMAGAFAIVDGGNGFVYVAVFTEAGELRVQKYQVTITPPAAPPTS